MGEKIFTVRLKTKEPARDDFKSCASRLSEKRRCAAETLAREADSTMTSPIAIFCTIYGDGRHKRFRLCGIYEESELPKKLAKIAAKHAKDGGKIVINSNLEHIDRKAEKRIRKAKKKVTVSTFNRSASATTIFVID